MPVPLLATVADAVDSEIELVRLSELADPETLQCVASVYEPETETVPWPMVKVPEKVAVMPVPLLATVADAVDSEIELVRLSELADPETLQCVASVYEPETEMVP